MYAKISFFSLKLVAYDTDFYNDQTSLHASLVCSVYVGAVTEIIVACISETTGMKTITDLQVWLPGSH